MNPKDIENPIAELDFREQLKKQTMSKAKEFEKIELQFCKEKFNLPYGMTMYDKRTLRELAEFYLKHEVNAINDDFKKILEDESDCKGIYLTKGTIRGSEALDAFEIWINKLLKQ